ncbi:hypothetical protein GW17_00034675 [Ensete ventricosum]|nr:hypothetical protein GW17_00034675 [Ensete ventricosum]
MLLTEASWGDFFSPRGLLEEKTFSLPTQGEGTRQRRPYHTELSRYVAGAGAGGDIEKPLISKDDRSLLESLSSRIEIERGGNGGKPCVRFPQQAPYATSTWRQRRLRNAVQPPDPEPPFPPNPPFAVHGRQRSRADLLPPIVPTPIAGPQPRRSPRLLHQAAVHPIPATATATATAAAAAVAISAADAKPAAEFNVAFFDLPDTAEPAAVRFDAATESDPAASRRSGGRQRDAAARRDLRWTDEFRWRPDPAAAAAAAGCRSSRCRNGTVGDDYTGRTDIDAARADCSAFQSAVSDACSGLPMLYRCHFFTVP